MSNDELIEKYNEFINDPKHWGLTTEQSYMAFARSLDQWTPVEDGLPEDNRSVLMTDGSWVDSGILEDGVWYWSAEPEGHKDVIAWRELPAPYQPQGEGKD